MERAADVRQFCSRIRDFFVCRSKICPKFCRRKKNVKRKKSRDKGDLKFDDENSDDEENPSKPIFSPEDNSDRAKEQKLGDEKHHDNQNKGEGTLAAKAHKKNKKRKKKDEEILKGQARDRE